MPEIKAAFWNLQNLFDVTASDVATDLEFTPEEGWTKDAMEAKIANLAEIIKLLHGGTGPDLLGLCEIENHPLAEKLAAATGRTDLKVVHADSPDLRGIDTCLFYSSTVFKKPLKGAIKSHAMHLRYPTRDIFEVELEVKATGQRLLVLVTHWPSRSQGKFETEPLRIATAERCGRVVDDYLRFNRAEFLELPDTAATREAIIGRWNRNVLLMGDFNDEPCDRSVLERLQATRDLDRMEEDVKIPAGKNKPAAAGYLGREAHLYNCMWPHLGRADEGTHYFSGSTNSFNLLDQIIVSRGLLYGLQGLKIDLPSVEIFRAPPIAAGAWKRPVPFDRKTLKGYSDHFPVQCRLALV
ncbi:MAG TPA: endonuclease/exonuclease/phosphatase family protein [Chthoniobacteraceae bacterium]|nr:endonuclease/exonuclease/phosphatase family protein [Chthoniobacteraceae bacterium]